MKQTKPLLTLALSGLCAAGLSLQPITSLAVPAALAEPAALSVSADELDGVIDTPSVEGSESGKDSESGKSGDTETTGGAGDTETTGSTDDGETPGRRGEADGPTSEPSNPEEDPKPEESSKGEWKTVEQPDGSSKVFYLVDGKPLKGDQQIDGDWYCFAEDDGARLSGWQQLSSGAWRYFDPTSGKRASGDTVVDGRSYCFDASTGEARTGFVTEGGVTRLFDPTNCWLVQGWFWTDGAWYFCDDNGVVQTGFVSSDGDTYYLGTDGRMLTGWQLIDGSWYYFTEDGAMATGWCAIWGEWYLMAPDGRMLTGWQWSNNAWYYLNASGAMLTGWQAIDGEWYYLDPSDGAMAVDWLQDGDYWYYLDPSSGAMVTGWLYWGGDWYYFDPSGSMATGVRTIDGQTEYFLGNGRWTNGLSASWIDAVNRANIYGSPTPYIIMVDLDSCLVHVLQGSYGNWGPLREMICSPGAPATPTVRGVFEVDYKGYAFGYGHGYTCYYFTSFYGDYLFHSVLYNEGTFVIQDGRLGMHLSHGCVRMDINDAKWIYDNMPYGTTVVVY